MLADADEMHEIRGMEATIENINESPQLVKFTPLTAREMQARGVIARKANQITAEQQKINEEVAQKAKELEISNNSTLMPELRARVIRQLEDLDKQWKKQPSRRTSIALAQATLWKLLFPQPKAQRSRRDFTPAEPIE